VKSYVAPGITVTFDAQRCLHAAECVRGLPAVFNAKQRPWIEPGSASPEEVAEVVRRCPSGALQYVLDDGPPEEPPAITTVTARADGPLWIHGDVVVLTDAGEEVHDTRAALCRCGTTANAPFCDGSGDCLGWRTET
jgi:uncharacterized Fe-S cluster protein YjdI/CDGSH-type Zn-finger protein